MVTAIRKVNTEINFPESPASFYSIGQGSACSGVLLSAHIKGADSHAAAMSSAFSYSSATVSSFLSLLQVSSLFGQIVY